MKQIGQYNRTVNLSISRNGSQLYATDDLASSLVSADPPTTEQSSYAVVIADPALDSLVVSGSGLVGADLTVTQTGKTSSNTTVTLIVYKGKITAAVKRLKTDSVGESVVQLTCGSPLYRLNNKNNIVLSKDSFRAKYPNDACCDQIGTAFNEPKLLWGALK